MRTMVITGGAGFIGVNAAARFAKGGWEVTIVDNLSRRGGVENLESLAKETKFRFHEADVRDADAMDRILAEARPRALLHLAAQVAVTTSVADPGEDFEVNARGSFNVLEAVRRRSPETFAIFASTNKVYGDLGRVGVALKNGRWEFADLPGGVSEDHPLDFHSPYGCSKGAADQYFLDFWKSYGVRTAVFRQSCIYGPRQFGIEDQGWLAWFVIAAVTGRRITIYGDGRQIRDVLHVDDLLDAYEAAIVRPEAAAGQAFNVGGGPGNTLSLLELLAMLEERIGRAIPAGRADWRVGDQKVFVSCNAKAGRLLGWAPAISCRTGVGRLYDWVTGHRDLFESPVLAGERAAGA